MIVMRQDFGDTLLTHHIHGYAVGQAVFLVGPGFVESKAGEECLAGLRVNGDGLIGMKITNQGNSFPTEKWTRLGKSVQNFNQYFIRCDQMATCEISTGLLCGLMPLV